MLTLLNTGMAVDVSRELCFPVYEQATLSCSHTGVGGGHCLTYACI